MRFGFSTSSLMCIGPYTDDHNAIPPSYSEMTRARNLSPAEQEARRLKNREFMRNSRGRQRQKLQDMKVTVQLLETQYAELCRRSEEARRASPAAQLQVIPSSKLERDYNEAVAVAKRLGAEKLYLRNRLQETTAWQRLVQRAIDFEASSVASARLFQTAASIQVDMVDQVQAAEELGFYSLRDWDFTRAILDHRQQIYNVETRLLQTSETSIIGGIRTNRMQALGWTIVQRVETSVMEFVFSKRFSGLDVLDTMNKTWSNDILLERFRTVKAETCRLQVLQQLNPTAFVFVRDVASPSAISIFRSVFVHFLVEATKEFSADGETTLTGTGYVLGTHSVHDMCPPIATHERGRMEWADLCLTTEMYDVVDPDSGEVYQEVFWAGRTDYCTQEDALRNAADNLQGLLRWEMHIVAPALTLPLLKC